MIEKCPCCGDTISIFTDSGFWECDSCPFMCGLADLPRIAAAMKAEARHNALVEAVKKYLDCSDICGNFEGIDGELRRSTMRVWSETRAEVDRLIANEGPADCKGEG